MNKSRSQRGAVVRWQQGCDNSRRRRLQGAAGRHCSKEPCRASRPGGGGDGAGMALLQAQLLPHISSSQNQRRVAHRNEASAVSMAATDPVFIHGGEQLQNVPFLEAQVTVSSTGVVTQRPDRSAQQTPLWICAPGTPLNKNPNPPPTSRSFSPRQSPASPVGLR